MVHNTCVGVQVLATLHEKHEQLVTNTINLVAVATPVVTKSTSVTDVLQDFSPLAEK